MPFVRLNSLDQLPSDGNAIIYKHSDCPIAANAKGTLKKFLDTNSSTIYELHVVDQRPLSNEIAAHFGVQHESPQILVVRDGKVTAHESHFHITHEWLGKNV